MELLFVDVLHAVFRSDMSLPASNLIAIIVFLALHRGDQKRESDVGVRQEEEVDLNDIKDFGIV